MGRGKKRFFLRLVDFFLDPLPNVTKEDDVILGGVV